MTSSSEFISIIQLLFYFYTIFKTKKVPANNSTCYLAVDVGYLSSRTINLHEPLPYFSRYVSLSYRFMLDFETSYEAAFPPSTCHARVFSHVSLNQSPIHYCTLPSHLTHPPRSSHLLTRVLFISLPLYIYIHTNSHI
jgi:hypothetical protein